ncbi:expansin [Marchantia polymorpha subsp. ruderalis]|uniref:Expansin n=2 Tax=Marchantia polymorpha TaxID=3197 RepID=A0AAF6BCJ5_MARPO|nr:hypothetical protein MARPO_0090s0011 [Marchantia polymorpha]BBN09729.1 hypothetical protein Mp_4g22180 [Marchantia polymorpha subsp. ruderalis]|eukprot:PTQ33260.1 hypothetical protein MARPO_0090s0011 [Marchantia polymorpha]
MAAGLAAGGRMAQLWIVGLLMMLQALWSPMGVAALPAHATFYGGSDASGTNNGACGYSNVLSTPFGTMTAALSSPLFNEGLSCGSCYKVRCSGSSTGGCIDNEIMVTATNLCPHGSEGGWCDGKPHFDMSQPAFSQIAKPVAGVVEVEYTKVPCPRKGGMQFTVMGHTYFLQVLIFNVGGSGDVTAVKVRGGNGEWIAMTRSWGQLWQTGKVLDGQALSFQVTTSNGKTCVSNYVAGSHWKYGQTFEGSQY